MGPRFVKTNTWKPKAEKVKRKRETGDFYIGVPSSSGGVWQRVKRGHSYKSPLFLFTFSALGFHVFVLTSPGPTFFTVWIWRQNQTDWRGKPGSRILKTIVANSNFGKYITSTQRFFWSVVQSFPAWGRHWDIYTCHISVFCNKELNRLKPVNAIGPYLVKKIIWD